MLFRKFVVGPSVESGAQPFATDVFFGVALNALLATPLMMAQMAALQLVSGDTQVRSTTWRNVTRGSAKRPKKCLQFEEIKK